MGCVLIRMNAVLAELIKGFRSGAMKSSYHQHVHLSALDREPEATRKCAGTSEILNMEKERNVNVDSFNQHLRTHCEHNISAKC